jgi:alpha-D-xyloside xylohydrolase
VGALSGRSAIEGGRAHRLRLAIDEIALFARRGARIPLGGPAGPLRGAITASEFWQA